MASRRLVRRFAGWLGRLLTGTVVSILLAAAFLTPPAVLAVGAYRTAQDTWNSLPTDLPVSTSLPEHSVMLAADGSIIARFYGENRLPVTLDQVPQVVRDAIIATEDSRFYTHRGVDWLGTARAVVNNARGGGRQGGSGITQQYVKNLLVVQAETQEDADAARSFSMDRKLREARYALALEQTMTKDEILTGYLNAVYFGDGAYGIGAAAKHYFNKAPAQLTAGEAALLAGVINNPTAFNPVDHPDAARDRRDHVLDRMVAEGYLTRDQANRASGEPILLDLTQPRNGCTASTYPLYCQWVRDILATDPAFGQTPEQRQQLLYQGGLVIQTPLDRTVQDAATRAARDALPAAGRIATGIAVVEPGTGHVLALATNKKFGQGLGQTEILVPVTPKFQNGSTFKPLTAAAALESGWDPAAILQAGPTYTPGHGRKYPKGGFHNAGDGPGATTDMAGALRHSINTWFVMLEDQIGVKPVARVAKAMGLKSLPLDTITEKDAALTLGAWDTSPLQVANAYATLSAHGVHCNTVGVTALTTNTGESLPVPDPDCTQIIRASTADTITGMLTGVIYAPDGTGFRARLEDDRPAAGKTGSTNDYGAAWFAGYTPQYATAVWVGDLRGPQYNMSGGVTAYRNQFFRPVYGGTIPALVWKNTMDSIHAGLPIDPFVAPGGDASLRTNMRIPDVRGMEPADALRVLADVGLTGTVVTDSPDAPAISGIPAGRVTKTIPAAGALPVGSERTVQILVR